MLETLALLHLSLRMPHRFSIGFGQSITFTLRFFSKAVVILEVCLGSLSCWNNAAQSPKGGDHALLHYVTVHVGIHGSLNEL